MRLLSTDRAELHHFSSPEVVPDGYAILSHTWGNHEQTFQVTQALQERYKKPDENPRDHATQKVRESCILAEQYGYRWIWNDTCCIDKTSSAEHSEAINSMFRWYSLAEVCFACMEGVHGNPDCDPHLLDARKSAFREARWHFRGWTLQELIAPSLVIFVCGDWKTILGNKVELADLLQSITSVPSQVLTGEKHYSLVSIAERMSWASKRNTARVEDEAYCLIGLFNVDMPTIYGEGRQAFRRLQLEIMKESFDTSLFAWGGYSRTPIVASREPQEIYDSLLDTSTKDDIYLLANSPKRFSRPWKQAVRYTADTADPSHICNTMHARSNSKAESDASEGHKQSIPPFGGGLPTFSVTSYGLKCHLPIIELEGLVVAVLLCDNGSDHLGLLLHRSIDNLQDPLRKKYNTGYASRRVGYEDEFARLTSLGKNLHKLKINNKDVTAEWREIFIAHSPPPIERDVAPSRCSALHSISPAPPFRVPTWLINELARAGMELQRVDTPQSRPDEGEPLRVSVVFEDIDAKESIRLVLGTCVKKRSSEGAPSHWAKAIPQTAADWHKETDDSHHKCDEHHIDQWSKGSKDFGDDKRTVGLSFSPCRLTPKHTLVVCVELKGEAYGRVDELKKPHVDSVQKEAAPGVDITADIKKEDHDHAVEATGLSQSSPRSQPQSPLSLSPSLPSPQNDSKPLELEAKDTSCSEGGIVEPRRSPRSRTTPKEPNQNIDPSQSMTDNTRRR